MRCSQKFGFENWPPKNFWESYILGFICQKFLFLVRLAAKMPIRACPADGVLL